MVDGVAVPLIGGALVIGAILGVGAVYQHSNVQEQVCTIEDKDRTKGESGSDARLYTEECGVLQVNDAWFRGVFDSADNYAEIEVGQTYHLTTYGWRIPFLSVFPNVVEVSQ